MLRQSEHCSTAIHNKHIRPQGTCTCVYVCVYMWKSIFTKQFLPLLYNMISSSFSILFCSISFCKGWQWQFFDIIESWPALLKIQKGNKPKLQKFNFTAPLLSEPGRVTSSLWASFPQLWSGDNGPCLVGLLRGFEAMPLQSQQVLSKYLLDYTKKHSAFSKLWCALHIQNKNACLS